MQKTSFQPFQLVHLQPTEIGNLRTARQVFNAFGVHILPFNDERCRAGCLSAVVLDKAVFEVLRLHVVCINQQSPIPHQDVLKLIV